MSTEIDKIIASAPIDSTASKVTSESKEQYSFTNKDLSRYHASVPPQLIPIPKHQERNKGFENLIGRTFGHFTVIGYLGKPNPKKKTKWAVRCVCGKYEVRSTPSIKNEKNSQDRCLECKKWVKEK